MHFDLRLRVYLQGEGIVLLIAVEYHQRVVLADLRLGENVDPCVDVVGCALVVRGDLVFEVDYTIPVVSEHGDVGVVVSGLDEVGSVDAQDDLHLDLLVVRGDPEDVLGVVV